MCRIRDFIGKYNEMSSFHRRYRKIMQLCLQQERRRQQQQQPRQTNKRSTQIYTFGIDNNTPYEFIIHTRNKVNVQPFSAHTHFIESGKNRRAAA